MISSRKTQAEKHFKEMQENYNNEIYAAIESTEVYSSSAEIKLEKICFKDVNLFNPNIQVIDSDTVTESIKHPNCTVLNFASYKHPGGGFMKGTMAQEEALCHASTLYNVLSTQRDFYAWNTKNLNGSLYKDRLMWNSGIIFIQAGHAVPCNVITCAAPNIAAAKKNGATEEENLTALHTRIRMILDVAMFHNTQTIILGAYGCGVFGQNPETVANIFREEIHKGISIKNIIFAIPAGNKNLEKFEKVFCD